MMEHFVQHAAVDGRVSAPFFKRKGRDSFVQLEGWGMEDTEGPTAFEESVASERETSCDPAPAWCWLRRRRSL